MINNFEYWLIVDKGFVHKLSERPDQILFLQILNLPAGADQYIGAVDPI